MKTVSLATSCSRCRSADTSPGFLCSRTILHAGCRILQFVLCVSAMIAVRPAVAESLMIRVGDATVTEGESGFLDVSFAVAEETFDLAAYMIELNLSGPTSGVRFTGLAKPSDPVFPGRTPKHTSTRPEFPGNVAAANNDLPAGSAPITDGAGLMRVLFETDPGSAGVYDVSVESGLLRTNFTNGEGYLLSDLTDVSFASGQITVLGIIPEPSAIVYVLAGMLTLATVGWTRRRTKSHLGQSDDRLIAAKLVSLVDDSHDSQLLGHSLHWFLLLKARCCVLSGCGCSAFYALADLRVARWAKHTG